MSLKDDLARIVVTDSAQKDLTERVDRYHQQLFAPEGIVALQYLTNERGLTESTIKHFKLGYVADPLPIDRGTAQGRLAIPHRTLNGYRTIRFRALGETPKGVPKYWQPAGTTVGVFGVETLATPASQVIVTEGEIDAITLWQAGYPAIGFPGAQSIKPYQEYLFEGFERVIICGDGDEAGQAFTNKLANMVPNPTPVTLPDGKDINEVYNHGGQKALTELLGH
jgi:DNA primase